MNIVPVPKTKHRKERKYPIMQLSNLLLVVALTLPTVFARTPRNCGLACHSVKKCMVSFGILSFQHISNLFSMENTLCHVKQNIFVWILIENIFTFTRSCHFQAVLDGSGGNRPGQVGTIWNTDFQAQVRDLITFLSIGFWNHYVEVLEYYWIIDIIKTELGE